MLTIRLQRVGKKNQAAFRIVLAEKQRAVKKQVVEILGHYNPRSKEFGVKDQERLKYWIAQRVEISPTVHNLLIAKGLLQGQKVKAWKPKKRQSADLSAVAPTKAEASTKVEKQASEQQAAAVAELKAEEKPVEAKAATETKEEAKSTKPAEAPAAGASAPVAGTKEEPPPTGN